MLSIKSSSNSILIGSVLEKEKISRIFPLDENSPGS